MDSDSTTGPRPDETRPSAEVGPPARSGETIELAEKVRFWQEQDRINRALIPRVIGLHDELVRLGRTLEGVAERLEAVEARAAQTEALVPVHVDERTERIRTLLAETSETTSTLEGAVRVLRQHVESETDRAAERAHLRRRLRQTQLGTLAALLIAIVALLVSAL